jgi:hypothetical protein
MKEFIEKLIGRLEELKKDVVDNKCPVEKNSRECEMEYACETCYLTKTINIINELAEEFATDTNVGNKTNADRIRSMTDEELAEFLINYKNTFGEQYEGKMSCLDWLKSEAQEEGE